jgi:hypothetical protein
MGALYHMPQRIATIFLAEQNIFALQVIFEKLYTVGVTFPTKN